MNVPKEELKHMEYSKREALKRYKEVSQGIRRRIKAEETVRKVTKHLLGKKEGRTHIEIKEEEKQEKQESILLDIDLEGLLTLTTEEERKILPEESPKRKYQRRKSKLVCTSDAEESTEEESEESNSLETLEEEILPVEVTPKKKKEQAEESLPEGPSVKLLDKLMIFSSDITKKGKLEESGEVKSLFNIEGIDRVKEKRYM